MRVNRETSYVLIENKTKRSSIGRANIADSFFSRFKGLMLKKKLEKGLILKLPSQRGRRAAGIHMFFMRMPLDLIFVDNGKRVVDVATLDPWQTYTPIASARYIIEVEKGKLKDSHTEIGDELDFICGQA